MSSYLDFKASERQATVTPSLRTPTGRRLTTIANTAIGITAASFLTASLLLGAGATNELAWLTTAALGLTSLATSAAAVTKLARLEVEDHYQEVNASTPTN